MVKESIANSESVVEHYIDCPVCDGHKISFLREVYDDRYGHPELFKLVRCQDCGHIMTTPMPGEYELASLYGTYYPRENINTTQVTNQAAKVTHTFSKIRRWWRGDDNNGQYYVRPGEKMLDIGCGSGLSLLEARKLGVEAWGVEADPNIKRFADELDLQIHQGSIHDNPFPDVTFDLIVLNQVIEHIPEPEKTLKLIRSRLAENGRVILVFPNINSIWSKLSGERWINWHIPYHLHHFSKKTFVQMAERCGYYVERTRTITPNIWTLMQLRAIRQSIKIGQPNPIWEVKVSNSSLQPKITKRILLRKILLTPALTGMAIVNRLVDMLGFGDSLIVELKPKDIQ